MESNLSRLKLWITGILGLLTAFWGWLGWLAAGWIAAMALDYITGSLAAAKRGAWSSAGAREGIWHKAGMIVVVVVAAGADLLISVLLANLPLVELPVAYTGMVCPVVLVWYIITELGSMVENAADMGSDVPPWLLRLLTVGKNAIDDAGEAIAGEIPHKAHKIQGGVQR